MFRLNEKIDVQIEKFSARCKKLGDYLTENPELSGDEKKACAAYQKLLEEDGFLVETDYLEVPHAFLAVKKGLQHDIRPKALLLCEYDALPEVGHACGHSISGAASLLAGFALHGAYPDLPIRIDFMGTPAEEDLGGKELLLRNNAFEGYEFAAMAHMFSNNSPTFNALACDDRYITFTGKSSHASCSPADGINAMNAARLYMDAMDMWRQHLPQNAQFHGVLKKCGEQPNIVPEKAELDFYFRAATLHDLSTVCEISERCCKAAALATGCTYTSEKRFLTFADLYLTPTGDALMRDIFDAMEERYSYSDYPQGSTDAGNVDQHIPVFHPLVNISNGSEIPLHTSDFLELVKSETGAKGLRNAAVLLANLIYSLATNPEIMEAVKREHHTYRGI